MIDVQQVKVCGFAERKQVDKFPLDLKKHIATSSKNCNILGKYEDRSDKKKNIVVNIPLGQFGGPLRNGDMIALLNVIEHLRQISGCRIRAFLAPHVIHNTEYNLYFHHFLLNHSDYFSKYAGNYELDCNAVNLWDYRSISGDLIMLENSNPIQRKICVFPVFDAAYNVYRNWPIELINGIIAEYSSTAYSSYEKFFCAISEPDGLVLRDFTTSKDFGENLRHIMTCEIFIGGDTGTSHFASVLQRGPQKKKYYYTNNSAIHTLPFHLSDGLSELKPMWWDDFGKNPQITQIFLMETSKMRVFALRDPNIGDCLTTFPALYKLAQIQEFRLWIGNLEVRGLWAGPREALLAEDPGEEAEILTIHRIYETFSLSGLHMVQAWHWCLGLPIPGIWPRPPLNVNTSPSQDVDVFISPVSNSDAGTGLKVWSDNNWCELIDVLLAAGLTIAVGGQFSLGKSQKFWGTRPVLAVDAPPLSDLASYLQSARCVVTVDNGIGHLAHFLGVPHVQLIPEAPTLSGRQWVENKNVDAHVIYERFSYLTTHQVLGAIFSLLGRFNVEAYWEANLDLEQVKPRNEWRASELWVHYVFCGRREGRKLRP